MLTLAHISDWHIASEPAFSELLSKRGLGSINWHRARKKIHRPDVLAETVRDLKSAAPDHIAVTGDLVNLALEAEFAPARAWLDGHGVKYDFHDYKSAGIDKEKLKVWSDELGWDTLLNRAGTTFRKLPDGDKEGLNAKKALALMLEQPSMIKRPVLDLGKKRLVGFKPDVYAREVKAGR